MEITPHILCDPRFPEKGQELSKFFKSKSQSHIMWQGEVYSDSVERSINRSHKKIIEFGKARGDEVTVVIEDDAMFRAGGWEAFIGGIPARFDIYLGGVYGGHEAYVGRWHMVKQIVGFHCYMIHKRFYDSFLAVPDNEHIDLAQHDGLFLVHYPFVCLQRPGYSTTARCEQDKNTSLKPEDLYAREQES